MANSSILQSMRPAAPSQPLACRLRPMEHIGRNGPVPFIAELELENLSSSDVEIEYGMAVLQYLNLIVHDASGQVVSDHHYGDRFSPYGEARVLRLAPGVKYHARVHFFATMPRGPVAPGKYAVQAVYEYNGFRAESEPVEVTVEKSIE